MGKVVLLVVGLFLLIIPIQATECEDQGCSCEVFCGVYEVSVDYGCCEDQYDYDCDGTIEESDMQNAIDDFFQNIITIENIIEVIDQWKDQ
ncbi:MAG: hypothetical protein KKG59_01240 [Nanoarchaeota archaeon]|nr:hypothetical protein [Nanoarchaeota archaeon]